MKETFNITSSSRIEKIVMDDETRDIIITFKGEKVYRYHSVSEFDFKTFKEDIQNGESVVRPLKRESGINTQAKDYEKILHIRRGTR